MHKLIAISLIAAALFDPPTPSQPCFFCAPDGALPINLPPITLSPIVIDAPTITLAEPVHSDTYSALLSEVTTDFTNVTTPINDLQTSVTTITSGLPDYSAGPDAVTGIDLANTGDTRLGTMMTALTDSMVVPFTVAKSVDAFQYIGIGWLMPVVVIIFFNISVVFLLNVSDFVFTTGIALFNFVTALLARIAEVFK